MAKHEKTVVDVEVKTVVKKSVYKLELSPGEVHFVRWLLDYGLRTGLFNADNGGVGNTDTTRLKNLRAFWPQGTTVDGYDATTMFKRE